ncbi:MAG: CocE/NonD family hydrolase, partial [Pseudomonadota bacterium]|nr:CocE/NonD family hydrolase [Pseudomonadota bacterium]
MKTHNSIITNDGLSLSATIYSPKENAKAGVIINSATAVKQSYYQDFASFLASNGYLVVTYDYRGIGKSAIENTRDK